MEFNILEILKRIALDFAAAIPNVVGAIIVLIIGWIIAKFVANIVRRVLKTIQIDKYAEKLNDMDIMSNASFKIVPSTIFSKVMYYIVLLIFMIAATETLGMPAVSQLVTDLINLVPKLITAVILLAIGTFIADSLKNLVTTTLKSIGVPTAKVIGTVVFYFLFISVLMSALAQAGINTDFLNDNMKIIIAGAVLAFSIGYGLASKDVMGNMLASFSAKRRIQVGQKITIGKYSGEVINIDNSNLTIMSEGRKVAIPLNKINSEIIEFN